MLALRLIDRVWPAILLWLGEADLAVAVVGIGDSVGGEGGFEWVGEWRSPGLGDSRLRSVKPTEDREESSGGGPFGGVLVRGMGDGGLGEGVLRAGAAKVAAVLVEARARLAASASVGRGDAMMV